MKTHIPHSSAGFTLVELLVAILIMAILTVLSFSGVTRMRAAGEGPTAVANMRQFQIANIS